MFLLKAFAALSRQLVLRTFDQSKFPSPLKNFSSSKFLYERDVIVLWGLLISNASHFLVVVNCVYDEALFYTNDKYAAKTGKFIYRN